MPRALAHGIAAFTNGYEVFECVYRDFNLHALFSVAACRPIYKERHLNGAVKYAVERIFLARVVDRYATALKALSACSIGGSEALVPLSMDTDLCCQSCSRSRHIWSIRHGKVRLARVKLGETGKKRMQARTLSEIMAVSSKAVQDNRCWADGKNVHGDNRWFCQFSPHCVYAGWRHGHLRPYRSSYSTMRAGEIVNV